jgi:hypothetical protein
VVLEIIHIADAAGVDGVAVGIVDVTGKTVVRVESSGTKGGKIPRSKTERPSELPKASRAPVKSKARTWATLYDAL